MVDDNAQFAYDIRFSQPPLILVVPHAHVTVRMHPNLIPKWKYLCQIINKLKVELIFGLWFTHLPHTFFIQFGTTSAET